jgi:hypothetical protein
VRVVQRGGGGAAGCRQSEDNRWGRTRTRELDVGVEVGRGGGSAASTPARTMVGGWGVGWGRLDVSTVGNYE